MMKKLSGFTLIEILIATVILAILVAMIVSWLQATVRTQHNITAKADQLTNAQTSMLLMTRDFSQLINMKELMINNNEPIPMLNVHYVGKGVSIEFTRTCMINPMFSLKRSTLQRVRYYYDGDTLYRVSWFITDKLEKSTEYAQALLTGVRSFTINVIDNNKNVFAPGETN